MVVCETLEVLGGCVAANGLANENHKCVRITVIDYKWNGTNILILSPRILEVFPIQDVISRSAITPIVKLVKQSIMRYIV